MLTLVCRPYITVKGQKLWAKDYGRKAWCFPPRSGYIAKTKTTLPVEPIEDNAVS